LENRNTEKLQIDPLVCFNSYDWNTQAVSYQVLHRKLWCLTK